MYKISHKYHILFVNIIYILYLCIVFGSQTNTKGEI